MGSTADWRDVCSSITFSASVSQLVTILTKALVVKSHICGNSGRFLGR